MAFVGAMDSLLGDDQCIARTVGENGAPALTAAGVGDPHVALFFRAVRGATAEALSQLVADVVSLAERSGPEGSQERAAVLADLAVLVFQTRDVRGGKGERDVFRWLLVALNEELPETARSLLGLVPEYGCYKDLVQMIEHISRDEASTSSTELMLELRAAAVETVCAALRASDGPTTTADDDGEGRPAAASLLAAKWAPREGQKGNKLARELALRMFPEVKDPRRQYRRLVAGLNKRMKTVEVTMAAGDWDEIRPGAVPAACLKRQRAAFLNQKLKTRKDQSGGERSDDQKRRKCAENFLEHLKDPKKSVHGASLFPHDIVGEYMKAACHRGGSVDVDVVLEAQWVDLRDKIKEETGEEPSGLSRMVPLVDVSGSMSGTPMQVAIALGLLISELNHPEFRDRMLTFETTPQWHQLPPAATSTLGERVQSAQHAPWGGSTNFQEAMKLVLESCRKADMTPAEVGSMSLVVLSDMQFDIAEGCWGWGHSDEEEPAGQWATHYELLVGAFRDAGLASSHAEPYPVPTVVFWNLRGDTDNYPADASTPGVTMLGGFSQSMLKLFLSGDMEEMEDAQEDRRRPEAERRNAYQVLRNALDNERYRPVREVCAKVGEGGLAGYTVPEPVDWEMVSSMQVGGKEE